MDFGRQPKPVKIVITGEAEDVVYWNRRLKQAAEYKGDMTQQVDEYNADGSYAAFTIYPRAVND